MTQDNTKRDDIRHKVADTITLIETIMETRDKTVSASRKMPVHKDEHDLAGMKDTVRAIGERFIRETNNPDFNPVQILVNETLHARQTMAVKESAETSIAIECMAKAFGLSSQYLVRIHATMQETARANDNGMPPQQRGTRR
jgi:hypothetical protein